MEVPVSGLLSGGLFALYLVGTAVLAWRGGKKTSGGATFAIGSGRMNPWIAGMTLGACLASSAAFVVFPGFVYAEGLAALIGFSLPLIAGLGAGLLIFAPAFQRLGAASSVLTVPHWLGVRYDSPRLRQLFAGFNILNIAYLVLITVGCGYVMEAALGLSYHQSILLIVIFVFSYTGFGGAFAHAFTNSMQGLVMLGVALMIFGSGWSLWADGSVTAELATTSLTAPESVLFSTHFEVWILPFLIGVALTLQPHLLTKALYVEGRANLLKTVFIGIAAYCVFSLVLFAGVYGRLLLPAAVPQDQMMAIFLTTAFPWQWAGALASVAILAASMSTLDGLLVAITASVGGDLLPGRGSSIVVNRAVMVGLAVATLAIAWQPPKLVLILGQLGVYGLVAASVGPLVVGIGRRGALHPGPAALSALVALGLHFGIYFAGLTPNPGLSALAGMIVGLPIAVIGAHLCRVSMPQKANSLALEH